jgi:hypothetical protein
MGENNFYIAGERMDTKELFKLLVENALDFLARSIEELRDRPKYSVIHFHAAVELFLKARLMSDHWSLIVTKRQEPDWEKFIKGEFQSVSLDEAASKLEKTVRSGLTYQELCAFRMSQSIETRCFISSMMSILQSKMNNCFRQLQNSN